MKNLVFNYLIILLVLLLIESKANATAQFPDLLIEGNDTFAIFSNPLEDYLDLKQSRTLCGEKLEMTSTACYRGYQAIWTINNDSLFLVSVYRDFTTNRKHNFDLTKEFKTEKTVFAKWFTGQITSPRGSLLRYVHAGYASIYEKEKFIYITSGKIDSVRQENYLVYDKNLLNPSINFLSDTLYEIVLSNLNLSIFQNISEYEACCINIQFGLNGKIDSIYNEYTYDGESMTEKYILAVARQSLKKIPCLMKVTHKDYRPPQISLFYSGHCLKYPWDTLYGCHKTEKYSHIPDINQNGTIINGKTIKIFIAIAFALVCVVTLFSLYKKYKL